MMLDQLATGFFPAELGATMASPVREEGHRMDDIAPSRRAFLRFVAGSPLLSLLGLQACGRGESNPSPVSASREMVNLLASPEDAINVFDFQAMAEQVLPPAHYGYLATGVNGDETLHANREGLRRLNLRPRRLVDVSDIDMSVELLGERWETPIVLCPVGSQKAFHADGELAAARGSDALGHHQILSTVTTTSVEDVNAARKRPVWYQLYPTSSWDVATRLIERAEGPESGPSGGRRWNSSRLRGSSVGPVCGHRDAA